MKKNYLLCLLLFSFSCFAQFSKTHYIPPLSSSNALSAVAQKQYLYISTPNANPVNFKIIELGGNIINGTVSKSAPYVYYVGIGDNTQLVVPESQVSSILSNKGYIIEAEDLVYVSARVLAGIDTTTGVIVNNQSGALVSKGLAALGTQFRVGALLNPPSTPFTDNHYTFVSVLATENNTLVQFEDIKPGVQLLNNTAAGNMPAFITLNAGESFVMAVIGPWNANRDALIGSVVIADKPIAVNCGSFCGSNASGNLDAGFDQIVSAERTGQDYIFIKNTGQAQVERVLLVAHQNNTQVFLSATSGTPDYTLNAGDYIALDGNDYTFQGNLFVHASKNIFAYQTIGDNSRPDFANQELFFVPPLSCETPHVIDNIPLINLIGTRYYPISRITLVTETGSTVNVEVNGVSYPIFVLGFLPGVSVNGPTTVSGNPNYVTYAITGLSGNVGAFSTSQLYMAAYGTDGAATFGGFYSGFTFKPEIAFNLVDVTQTNCIPNTELSVNSLSPFDVFQWFFNDVAIPGATNNTYSPTLPGYYHLQATIANCGTTLVSDNIPISSCPDNFDNDLANDNIDRDNDNDGITDCTESVGDQPVDLSDPTILNVATSGTAPPAPVPFSGTTGGDFVTHTAIGKNNTVTFRKDFAQPTSVMLQYVSTASNADLINDNGEFVVNCDVSKTITVLNPGNQLLIDTNFDGIYESGITQFSSFEIRFRLNSATPLAAGSGTFRFRSSLTTSIAFTHRNLSDVSANRATFKLVATCMPIDSDGDGITNNFDSDSDNDGIPDVIESHGSTPLTLTTTDANADGLYDVFGIGLNPVDTDSDGVPDYTDLDSDNDGIYDLVESGSNATDTNADGSIDGNPADFGQNGLSDSVENTPDSAILTYSLTDSDTDGTNNYLETDSDGDACLDTVEAGFSDGNNDGLLGDGAVVTNASGVVVNAIGYSALPNANYTIYAPITIITQPVLPSVCETYSTSATVVSSAVDFYQWQVFTTVWANISNNATYSGVNSDVLQINNATLAMNGWRYRVVLQKIGNSCNMISDETTLTVNALPVITSPVTLIDCDEDAVPDGITDINLRQKEDFISNDAVNMTFTYYLTQAAAEFGDAQISNPDYINNPIQYNTGNAILWVRVANADGCFRVARLMVRIGATRIPSSFHLDYFQCDDFLDTNGNNNANNDNRDGIAYFDFSSASAAITAVLPTTSTFTIKYFKNLADANAVTDDSGNSLEISQNAADPVNIYRYRNTEFPNEQEIWVRVQSSLSNDCFGLGAYITLKVESLPIINAISPDNTIHHCDDDQDGIYGFDTSGINAAILGGQANVSLTYFDASGAALPSPLPNPFFVNTSQIIIVKASNDITFAPDGPCNTEGRFEFIVDDLPEAMPIDPALLTTCDDEANPLLQDGLFAFDTSTFESTILNGQTGMVVKYTDASGNPLPNPLPNPFVTATQNVTVTVQNPTNPDCVASQLLAFIVNPLPKIDLNTDGHDKGLICTNLPALTVTIGAGVSAGTPLGDYTYQWFLEGAAIPGEVFPTLTVAAGGNYSVEVTTALGCQRTREVKVYVSEIAVIRNIQINDLTDVNTIQVLVDGSGDYVYSLDYDAGYQDSNYFPDVLGGTHQVYVKDINGCGTVGPVEIYVLSVPKFFTPNGDGFHDTWNIKGVNEDFNGNTIIYIFDRFGKLVKQLNPLGDGWDGTFNGSPLPTDDYWYSIMLEDKRAVKGHFALKR